MVSTQKAQEQSHCVLDPRCGSRELFDLVASKWSLLVISALSVETKRSNELHREVEGISQKMLIQTLRGLELNGIVKREVYPVVPPKVEYALTPLGRSLTEVVGLLCSWAEENLAEVERARVSVGESGFDCHPQGS